MKNLNDLKSLQNLSTTNKVIAAVLICVLLFLGFRYFYSRATEDPYGMGAQGPIPVEVVEAREGEMVRRLKVAGSLIATQSVTIRPEVNGRVAKIFFEEGQEVKKGDSLYKIEDGVYAAKVKEAEAKLALSKVEYDRTEALLKKDFGSAQKRDQALSVMRINQAELASAKIHLENTLIKAPFDGNVGLSNVSVGAFVSESVELVTIVDLSPLNVDFNIAERHLGAVKVGEEVDVTISGYDSLPMDAKIKAVSPEVDLVTRTVKIRAEMENPDLALRPGQFANIVIEAGKAENAVIIPEAAIEKEGDEEYVMRIEEGVAIRTVVDTNLRDGSEVEITNGLKVGDKVVVAGQFKLQDGQEVTIMNKNENGQD